MQTTIFKVIFFDGREFKIFCKGKSQINRFLKIKESLKNDIWRCEEILNGIHTLVEFEQITNKI